MPKKVRPRGARKPPHMPRIVAGVASILLLAACGSSGSGSGGGSTAVGVMAVSVHQDVITGKTGAKKNVLAACKPSPQVTWQLEPYTQMQQLTLRQGSLGSSSTSVVFLLDSMASPQLLNLLEPLDAYQKSKPIEAFSGFPTSLLTPFERDGKLYGIPTRTTVDVMFYDKDLLSSVGASGAPTSMASLVDIATKVAGKNTASGLPVYGIRFSDTNDLAIWVRSYGGDLIDKDYKLHLTEQPTIEALTQLHKLYTAGAIPKDFFNLTADDWLRMEQQGQVAMTFRGGNYYPKLNDPKQSKIAGNVGIAPIPAAEGSGNSISPSSATTWYMSILKNGQAKDAAWNFIRCVSSPSATLDEALNTNTPSRPDTLDDPTLTKQMDPQLRKTEQQVLKVSSPAFPAFNNQAKALKILQDALTSAVKGDQSPQAAMTTATSQIQPLLPTGS